MENPNTTGPAQIPYPPYRVCGLTSTCSIPTAKARTYSRPQDITPYNEHTPSPAMDAARDMATDWLRALNHAPTLLVDTGRGLQAWWLFQEPWILEKNHGYLLAQPLAIAWHHHLLQLTQNQLAITASFDITRILRIPGTTNRTATPVPVTLISGDGPRHSLNDFLPHILVEMQPDTGAPVPFDHHYNHPPWT